MDGSADALDLLVDILQLQVEQFAPHDPELDGLAEKWIATTRALPIKAIQTSSGLCEPFVDRYSSPVLHRLTSAPTVPPARWSPEPMTVVTPSLALSRVPGDGTGTTSYFAATSAR